MPIFGPCLAAFLGIFFALISGTGHSIPIATTVFLLLIGYCGLEGSLFSVFSTAAVGVLYTVAIGSDAASQQGFAFKSIGDFILGSIVVSSVSRMLKKVRMARPNSGPPESHDDKTEFVFNGPFAQRIAELVPNNIYVFDLNKMANVYTNQDTAAYLGYTTEDIKNIGDNLLLKIIHPEDLRGVQAHLLSLSKRGDREVIEHQYRVKNSKGEWRNILARDSVFLRDANGNVTQIVGISQDITPLKTKEYELEQANKLISERKDVLNSFYNSTPLMMGVVEVFEDDVRSISENASSQSFGKLVLDARGQRSAQHAGVQKAILDLWLRNYRKARDLSQAVSFEYEDSIEGRAYWFRAYISYIGPIENGVGRFSYSKVDLTEQKVAEKSLQETRLLLDEAHLLNLSSLLKYKAVSDSASDAIIVADERGLIRSWNYSAEKIFGYSEREIIGKAISILMPERYIASHTSGLARFKETGESSLFGHPVELDGKRKDGTEFKLEMSLSFWMQEGKHNFTSIIRDISDRKKTELDNKNMHELMESFFDSSPARIGIVETSDDNIFHVRGNKASALSNRRSIEEMKNKWVTDLGVTFDALPKYLEQYKMSKDHRKPMTFEAKYEHEGTTQWISSTVNYIGPGEENRDRYSYTILDLTEMRMADIALQASEDRLEKFFSCSLDMLAIANHDGYFTRVNPSFEEVFGYTTQELLASPLSSFVHPEDVVKTNNETQSLKDGNPTMAFQNRWRCKDGRYKWIAWKAVAVGDSVYAAGRDMTDRIESEEYIRHLNANLENCILNETKKLRESEASFRKLADSMPQIVWTANPDGYLDYYNERWYDLTGFPRGSGGDNSWLPIMHEDDTVPCLKKWYASVETGEDYEIEYRFWDQRLSEYRWYLGRALPVRDKNGLITKWYGTCVDIHERKILASELIKSQKQLKTVIDNAPIAIWSTDKNGLFTLSDGKALKQLGLTPEDRLGQSIYDTHKESVELLSAMRDALQGKASNLNVYYHGGCYDTFVVPIANEKDEVTSVIGLSIDVTARVNAERDRSELTIREQGALESSRLKSEFLANMSHEIRTPINGVLGMTGLLLDSNLSPEQFEYADAVRRSGESLLTVINDILDFSKIEAGKLDFELLEFNLVELFHDVVKTMRFGAEKKGIKLLSDLSQDLPTFVFGDPGRFRQILNNLISNAIKFTAKGLVTVKAAVDGSGSDRLKIEVLDTGLGITEHDIGKLFKAFTQADSTTARRFGGTGLGLTICKKLVECMGGSIGVKSVVNEGSTFWFTVNLKFSERKEIHPKALAPLKNRAPVSARILVAEDNQINQVVIAKMLTKLGFRVDVVGNGREALTALLNIPYDLVLMDCQMPEMDGYEATTLIRRDSKYPSSIPIIALTANAMKGDGDHCKAVGMNDYLSKPIKSDNLDETIRLWLMKSRRSGAA